MLTNQVSLLKYSASSSHCDPFFLSLHIIISVDVNPANTPHVIGIPPQDFLNTDLNPCGLEGDEAQLRG